MVLTAAVLPLALLTLFGLALDAGGHGAEAPLIAGAAHPWATYYAAAFAALFLLIAAARGAVLLRQEEDSGFLARLRLTPISSRDLIGGKMLALVMLGFAQLVLLFAFGWVAFDIEAIGRPLAFVLVCAATALAAAALALVLAAAVPSRRSLAPIAAAVVVAMALPGRHLPQRLPDWPPRPGATVSREIIAGWPRAPPRHPAAAAAATPSPLYPRRRSAALRRRPTGLRASAQAASRRGCSGQYSAADMDCVT
jgi:hypothetical protein